eukprot:403351017
MNSRSVENFDFYANPNDDSFDAYYHQYNDEHPEFLQNNTFNETSKQWGNCTNNLNLNFQNQHTTIAALENNVRMYSSETMINFSSLQNKQLEFNQDYELDSLSLYLMQYKPLKTCQSAPSVLVSPLTSCSDLEPQLLEAQLNDNIQRAFGDDLSITETEIFEDEQSFNQQYNHQQMKSLRQSDVLQSSLGTSRILRMAKDQVPLFSQINNLNLNEQVENILADCGYDKECHKIPNYTVASKALEQGFGGLDEQSKLGRAANTSKKIIKLSKRNISIQDLRKKKDKKTKQQKQILQNLFDKNSIQWSKAQIEKIARDLALQPQKVYKWNYDKFIRFQKSQLQQSQIQQSQHLNYTQNKISSNYIQSSQTEFAQN